MNYSFIIFFTITVFFLFVSIIFLCAAIKFMSKWKVFFKETYGEEIKYVEVGKLKEECWVKALERLKIIQSDPEISEAAMVFGLRDNKGHAWIEYKRKSEILKYDPTNNSVIAMPERKKE